MTPDKNNFQLLLHELEAKKLDISNRPHIANPYNEAIDDAIKIVTKHTAPQPNWDEVEKLVQILARKYARDYTNPLNPRFKQVVQEYEAELRAAIGYTINNKTT